MLRVDRGILLAIFFLIGLGLVQVYSSSYIFATEVHGDGLFFFRKQLIFAISVIGLCLTFVPHVGHKVGGAYRWVMLPLGFRFEPAELLRVSFPIAVASLMPEFGSGKIDRVWWYKMIA